MGLERELGLFQRTGKNGRLITDMRRGQLISGRPKRRLRTIVTRPAGLLLEPISREIKRQIRRGIKTRTRRGIKGVRGFLKPGVPEFEVTRKKKLKSLRQKARKKKEEKRELEEIIKLEKELGG